DCVVHRRRRGDRPGMPHHHNRQSQFLEHRVKGPHPIMTTTTDQRTVVVHARDVVKRFGEHTVLHGVDIDIREGEFLSVMGPSGCGKSTLLYAISGMDEPTSGEVLLDGVDLTTLSQRELSKLRLTHMGFIFQ